MAIFGVLELEDVLQVNDKTRLDATKSYVSKDEAAISLVEIEPHTGLGFIQVGTGTTLARDYYLDWQYDTSGTKTVSLRITTDGAPITITKDILVVTAIEDKLWSSDQDLMAMEPDVLKYVPQGKSSFLNVHRRSQKAILEWLDAIRIWAADGTRLEKTDILVTTDVKELSTYLTLHYIYAGLRNKIDDVYSAKAKEYGILVDATKNRGRIQADLNRNNTLDTVEKEQSDLRSFRIVRR